MRVLSRLMTYAEFLDWVRTFANEPFDDRRCFDAPAAAIQSTSLLLQNRESTLTSADFMPYGREEKAEDPAEFDARVSKLL